MNDVDALERYCQQWSIPLYHDTPPESNEWLTAEGIARRLGMKSKQLKEILIKNGWLAHTPLATQPLPRPDQPGAVVVKHHPDRVSVRTLYRDSDAERLAFHLTGLPLPEAKPFIAPVRKQGEFESPATPRPSVDVQTGILNTWETPKFELPRYILSIDTESTGMHPPYDRVVSIGMVCYDLEEGKVLDQEEIFINPRLPRNMLHKYRRSGFAVTGIVLPNMPEFDEKNTAHFIGGHKAVSQFKAFLDRHQHLSTLMVAHSVKCDVNALNSLLQSVENGSLQTMGLSFLCTYKMIRHINDHAPGSGTGNSMNALCQRFGVDTARRDLEGHGALLDAQMLAEALHKMYQSDLILTTELPSDKMVKRPSPQPAFI